MIIKLDTDKKTITVPYNYGDKLSAINKLIKDNGGDVSSNTFTGYIDKIWKYAIENSDECVKTAAKPQSKQK